MPRGRPAQLPTRSLNIRVEVDDLDMLAVIQTLTKVPTAEVVRKFLKEYIEQRSGLLKAMGAKLQTGSHWGGFEQGHLAGPGSSVPPDVGQDMREQIESERRLEAEVQKRVAARLEEARLTEAIEQAGRDIRFVGDEAEERVYGNPDPLDDDAGHED